MGSNSSVKEAVNAISWVHQLTGYPAIAESPFVRIVLDGLQRNLAKPKVRKEPVTTDVISFSSQPRGSSIPDRGVSGGCLPPSFFSIFALRRSC